MLSFSLARIVRILDGHASQLMRPQVSASGLASTAPLKFSCDDLAESRACALDFIGFVLTPLAELSLQSLKKGRQPGSSMASLQQNALRSSLSGSIAYCKDALPLPRRCLRRSSKKLGCTAVMTPPKEQVGAQTKDAAQDMAYWMEQESKFVVQTYARAPVVFKSGHGSTLVDLDGREYIDLAGGIAVNALGHSHPVVTDTIAKQSAELMHISNLYHNIPQISLAKRLVESSFADRVFFANSGTEANEAAIKFSRKYQRKLFEQKQGTNGSLGAGEGPATEFVAFSNCFHGRTMGAVALTAKSQYREPFAPVMPGVVGFPTYGDLESARAYIRAGKTAAVFVEPVQGEGGVYPATKEFLQGLRHLCDKAGALLVFDEIQCGLGRTGVLWAHEAYGIQPDIMTVAKPLAGGLPIGAVLVNEKVASAMAYGDHGSTFAGNPLVCAVALSVLDVVQEPGFLEGVAKRGEDMRENLRNGLEGVECVKEVRGSGLIIGVQLDRPAGTVVDMAREKGVLVITAGKGDVIRMVPPLIITEEELKRAGDTIVACIKALK